MFADWLDFHIQTFIKPVLGYVPEPYKTYGSLGFINHLLKGFEAAKKAANGRTILLPGRDVFLLEIVARMQRFPTIFRPELSGCVARYYNQTGNHHPWKDCFAVDSGYSGSVPKALGIDNWGLLSGQRALVPGDVNVSALCPQLEGSPKYWQRGSVNWTDTSGVTRTATDKLVILPQQLAPKEEFERAAKLTLFVASQIPIESIDKTRNYVFIQLPRKT